MKVNDSLKDAIARRDKQIEDMNQSMAQLAKAVAVKEENNGTTDIWWKILWHFKDCVLTGTKAVTVNRLPYDYERAKKEHAFKSKTEEEK